MKNLFQIKLALALLLIGIVGCQPPSETTNSGESTVAPIENTTLAPTQVANPTIEVTEIVNQQLQPTSTARPLSATLAITQTLVPTPTTTDFNAQDFGGLLAFLGWSSSPTDAVAAIFDTRTQDTRIIAQPGTAEELIGPPMFSPDNSTIAFGRSDSATHSVWLYDANGKNLRQVGPVFPRMAEGNNSTGLFIFGWSYDGSWLAYAYVHSPVERELYLLNVLTQESIQIEGNYFYWFAWSPQDNAFIYTDTQTLYVASVTSPNIPMSYDRSEDFIGMMTWHPTENKVLIGTSNNFASEGLNTLWLLSLDSEEWTLVGSFPRIAAFEFSPDGKLIAVYSKYSPLELNRVDILSIATGEPIEQIDLSDEPLFDLSWLDSQTIAFRGTDNIYILPTNKPDMAFWLLDVSGIYDNFQNIRITDWQRIE